MQSSTSAREPKTRYLPHWLPCSRRMFASAKNIVFGEDLSTDPVSRTLGLVLRFFTRGKVKIDVQLFSQVGGWCCAAPWAALAVGVSTFHAVVHGLAVSDWCWHLSA